MEAPELWWATNKIQMWKSQTVEEDSIRQDFGEMQKIIKIPYKALGRSSWSILCLKNMNSR